jgi:hypothetical protein
MFRNICYHFERLFLTTDDLAGCPACPAVHFIHNAFWSLSSHTLLKPDEDGDLYIALDGNFRLFRYRNASRHEPRLRQLDELIKEPLNPIPEVILLFC